MFSDGKDKFILIADIILLGKISNIPFGAVFNFNFGDNKTSGIFLEQALE